MTNFTQIFLFSSNSWNHQILDIRVDHFPLTTMLAKKRVDKRTTTSLLVFSSDYTNDDRVPFMENRHTSTRIFQVSAKLKTWRYLIRDLSSLIGWLWKHYCRMVSTKRHRPTGNGCLLLTLLGRFYLRQESGYEDVKYTYLKSGVARGIGNRRRLDQSGYPKFCVRLIYSSHLESGNIALNEY